MLFFASNFCQPSSCPSSVVPASFATPSTPFRRAVRRALRLACLACVSSLVCVFESIFCLASHLSIDSFLFPPPSFFIAQSFNSPTSSSSRVSELIEYSTSYAESSPSTPAHLRLSRLDPPALLRCCSGAAVSIAFTSDPQNKDRRANRAVEQRSKLRPTDRRKANQRVEPRWISSRPHPR